MVVATTNHPDRLDPAILERPSRFDRKYYFNLPAAPERAAYLALWNEELKPQQRLSEDAVAEVVRQTDGFSFAYLKELFLSAMMQWISTAERLSMDQSVLDQATRLRSQMVGGEKPQPPCLL